MPTTRPRHFVTETDELARALDEASVRWPDLSRAQALARLALEGHLAVRRAAAEARERRVATLRRLSGALTGAYESGYLDELRGEWPA